MLVEKGLHARAVGILEKALELQPSNEKIVGWLERARAEGGSSPPSREREAEAGEKPEAPPRLERRRSYEYHPGHRAASRRLHASQRVTRACSTPGRRAPASWRACLPFCADLCGQVPRPIRVF